MNAKQYQVEVFGYNKVWTSCGPEFCYSEKSRAENAVKVQKRNDWDGGLGALSYRVKEVA